jgi:hypothetical protein
MQGIFFTEVSEIYHDKKNAGYTEMMPFGYELAVQNLGERCHLYDTTIVCSAKGHLRDAACPGDVSCISS